MADGAPGVEAARRGAHSARGRARGGRDAVLAARDLATMTAI
ncbi:MAG: hypothetical protein QOF49_1190 [Chloroflexota bacterium]|jgi:hypothetical protein|nr:hypothetical protein [Chloroflexota bacterium]